MICDHAVWGRLQPAAGFSPPPSPACCTKWFFVAAMLLLRADGAGPAGLSAAPPAHPGFSHKKLARIQFTAALAQATGAGFVPDRRALLEACAPLLSDQSPDGSWPADTGAVGSPVTYGTALSTYMARRALEQAD